MASAPRKFPVGGDFGDGVIDVTTQTPPHQNLLGWLANALSGLNRRRQNWDGCRKRALQQRDSRGQDTWRLVYSGQRPGGTSGAFGNPREPA